MPQGLKTIIKNNLLSEDVLIKLDKLDKHDTKNHFKKHYNELEFPQTQFVKLKYNEISFQDKIKDNDILRNYDGSYHSKSNFFLESFGDDIIVSSESGSIFTVNNRFVFSNDILEINKIKSNLDDLKIQVLDILKVENDLIVSFSKFVSEKCFSLNIYKAAINTNELEFKKIFETPDCQPKFFAGRLFRYNHKNKDGVLVSVDVWGVTLKDEEKRYLSNMKAQDDKSSFGKILFVNYEGEYEVFSKGHRTPQGLFVTNDDFILSTEHGPRGGDEINLIKYKGNYGWPISSYGELYPNQEPNKENFFYKKSHLDNNFIEPIFTFLQSVGISQLIQVPENFSKYWNNNFLVSSLNGSSLFRIKFDDNFSRIIYFEKIFIGKRIRDIVYLDNLKTFVFSMDEGDGYLGFINSNSE